MKETHYLKNSHYEAMRDLGYTDDQIEEDWELFVKEYEEFLDLTLGRTADDYLPFGSSVPSKQLSAEEAEKLKEFEEQLPW